MDLSIIIIRVLSPNACMFVQQSTTPLTSLNISRFLPHVVFPVKKLPLTTSHIILTL